MILVKLEIELNYGKVSLFFFMCRRGWEWHDYQWNTFTNNGAEWVRYKNYAAMFVTVKNPKCVKPPYLNHKLCFSSDHKPWWNRKQQRGDDFLQAMSSVKLPLVKRYAPCRVFVIWDSRLGFCALHGSKLKPQLFCHLNGRIEKKQPSKCALHNTEERSLGFDMQPCTYSWISFVKFQFSRKPRDVSR